jgi:hypothetical protein
VLRCAILSVRGMVRTKIEQQGCSTHFLAQPERRRSERQVSIVIPHMKNSTAFIDQFHGYSSTVCASIGTVRRAMDQLFQSFKLS